MALTARLRDLFLWGAGVSRRTILACPETEIPKYVGLGGTVFFTACFAFISMTYALYRVFEGSLFATLGSPLLGALWGAFILNLDRWIVSSLRHGRQRPKFWQAAPRFALATLISFTIPIPLEVVLFAGPISRKLVEIRQDKMAADNNFYDHLYGVGRIAQDEKHAEQAVDANNREMWKDPPGPLFQDRLRDLRDARVARDEMNVAAAKSLPPLVTEANTMSQRIQDTDKRMALAQSEARAAGLDSSGSPALAETPSGEERQRDLLLQERAEIQSRIAGIRMAQRNAIDKFTSLADSVEQLRRNYHDELVATTAALRSRIGVLQNGEATAQAEASRHLQDASQITDAAYNGNFMSEVEALGLLTSVPFTTFWWTQLLLFLLFWSVETGPVVVKLLTPPGTYEYAVEAEEAGFLASNRAKVAWLQSEESASLLREEHRRAAHREELLGFVRNARDFTGAVQKEWLRFQDDLLNFEKDFQRASNGRGPQDGEAEVLKNMVANFWAAIAKAQHEFKSG